MEWKFIERADAIGQGIMENGDPFWESEIEGWNDNEEFTDLTELVVIRAVLSESKKITTFTKFHFPELENNPLIEKLIAEVESDLLDDAKSW
ncbi:hypothetical protein [Planomicrobium okeanokoites]|uniref:hypothetical protein n=1 Tax=Planomicrobium okeanokoites TaxID=244 RepID=UPI000A036696|nr:hypothetical protein [Planomicrobium okeanokoites]